ncbi:isocitrate lyase/phosphoenolpyruvate mutase family protein [Geomonas sp. RF6]|uniref:isocitrate lyase/PEP mutase family protein n=1 Tax=Geomonas sp. RF6 TaxID=2897342 RepID=UPI001E2BD46A|nr:isocitrate lyase/phosphoenolpyruvate mutase family protein [Geomonas sp. RF6]UFS70623.1 isocitrate lyase/phosphoenolpyruvate mutase family protein [Geomonas sp. RF6]
MDSTVQKEKAERLRSLHYGDNMLVLPNIWSPLGARILEKKGYPAVATASAAISAALGYEDGEKIKRATALDVIERIARAVDVPVTADIETGYGESLSELEETVFQVLGTGVAGINIEDGLEAGGALRDIDEQCQRIALVRRAAAARNIPLVINARIDSYFSSSFSTREDATEDAVARARAYSGAGADCVYPMGPGDEDTVRVLKNRIEGPLNILVTPNAAPLAVLQKLGVNRVSFGPFIFRSCMRKFADIADSIGRGGDYWCFSDMMSRAEVEEFLISGAE